MLVRKLAAALAIVLVTACGEGATENGDNSLDVDAALGGELTGAQLGVALLGSYHSVTDGSGTFSLRGDLTYAVVGGESGTWNLYRSPISGSHYVGLNASGSSKWLHVLQGTPEELQGAFGTSGDYVQFTP